MADSPEFAPHEYGPVLVLAAAAKQLNGLHDVGHIQPRNSRVSRVRFAVPHSETTNVEFGGALCVGWRGRGTGVGGGWGRERVGAHRGAPGTAARAGLALATPPLDASPAPLAEFKGNEARHVRGAARRDRRVRRHVAAVRGAPVRARVAVPVAHAVLREVERRRAREARDGHVRDGHERDARPVRDRVEEGAHAGLQWAARACGVCGERVARRQQTP